MNNSKSKIVLLIGFNLLLAMIIALSFLWFSNVKMNSERLNTISEARQKSIYIFRMRDAAYRRAIALSRMLAVDDIFEQDDEYMRFNDLAIDFLNAREGLLKLKLDKQELKTWNEARPLLQQGADIQRIAVEMILSDQLERANLIIVNEVIPTQDRVMKKLTQFLEDQQLHTDELLLEAEQDNNNMYVIVLFMTMIVIALGVIISNFVIRKIVLSESALLKSKKMRSI